MLALFLLGIGSLWLILSGAAIVAYRTADRIYLDRLTRTPWDDLA